MHASCCDMALNPERGYCRDDAQNKMLALKEKAEKELAQYNVELKELIRVIDHDRKLKEFMSCKDKERTEAHEQMEMMRRKKEAQKSSDRQNTVMVSGDILAQKYC